MVADATCLRRIERRQFQRPAMHPGMPFRILECPADVQTLRERIQKQNQSATDAQAATFGVLGHQMQTDEPLTTGERLFVI